MSEDDPLHSGVEFSDPEAAIPEQVCREGGREEGREGGLGKRRQLMSDFLVLLFPFILQPGSCRRAQPGGNEQDPALDSSHVYHQPSLPPFTSPPLPPSLDSSSGRRAESGGDEQDPALDPPHVHHG